MATLAEDLGSIPSTPWQLTTSVTPVPGDLMTSAGTRHVCAAQRYKQAKHLHTNNQNKVELWFPGHNRACQSLGVGGQGVQGVSSSGTPVR